MIDLSFTSSIPSLKAGNNASTTFSLHNYIYIYIYIYNLNYIYIYCVTAGSATPSAKKHFLTCAFDKSGRYCGLADDP